MTGEISARKYWRSKMENFHEKRKTAPRRKEDIELAKLIKACQLALRLKNIEAIQEVLKWAIEATEGKEYA